MMQSSVVGRQLSQTRSLVVGPWSLANCSLSWRFASGQSAALAQQKTLVLKGGKLLTISHGTIENGVLVISGGKISAIGAASSVKVPKDARSDRCDWDDGVSRTDRF